VGGDTLNFLGAAGMLACAAFLSGDPFWRRWLLLAAMMLAAGAVGSMP
jgi:hypothetical protein